jgi:hypothetical protein
VAHAVRTGQKPRRLEPRLLKRVLYEKKEHRCRGGRSRGIGLDILRADAVRGMHCKAVPHAAHGRVSLLDIKRAVAAELFGRNAPTRRPRQLRWQDRRTCGSKMGDRLAMVALNVNRRKSGNHALHRGVVP